MFSSRDTKFGAQNALFCREGGRGGFDPKIEI